MVANRQDAWLEEHDLLLAETVLRHIREGSTQLRAFEECAEKLGRTSAACGFRWNSVVRKDYTEAIALAKLTRQKRKKDMRQSYASYGTRDRTSTGRLSFREHATSDDGDQAKEVEAVEVHGERAGEEGELTWDHVLRFLRQEKARWTQLKKERDQLFLQTQEHALQIERLQKELEAVKNEKITVEKIQEDYQTLLKIMERARKLVAKEMLDEELAETQPVFKMDPNGNLERIEQAL
ncbi:MAG: RsfA family transcriptional regulator [Candidatus Carbobacillus altaicus]|nr:RsfA family transcriptional regulator [Candidatus Carbobacillus altaicus]